jgi:hypothetical protein
MLLISLDPVISNYRKLTLKKTEGLFKLKYVDFIVMCTDFHTKYFLIRQFKLLGVCYLFILFLFFRIMFCANTIVRQLIGSSWRTKWNMYLTNEIQCYKYENFIISITSKRSFFCFTYSFVHLICVLEPLWIMFMNIGAFTSVISVTELVTDWQTYINCWRLSKFAK